MLKIILIIIGIIFLLFMIAMIFFVSFAMLNKKELKPKELILESKKGKKALILYQKSRHNTATEITMSFAKELNNNGYSVTINHPSKKINYNIEDFDILAFGSAVYMGTISEPLVRYTEKISFKNKNVILYLVGMAPDVDVEIKKLRETISDAKSIDIIKVKKGEDDKINEFVKKFLKKIGD